MSMGACIAGSGAGAAIFGASTLIADDKADRIAAGAGAGVGRANCSPGAIVAANAIELVSVPVVEGMFEVCMTTVFADIGIEFAGNRCGGTSALEVMARNASVTEANRSSGSLDIMR